MTWRSRKTGWATRSTGSGRSAPPANLAIHACRPWNQGASAARKGMWANRVTKGYGSTGRAMERSNERRVQSVQCEH